MQIERQLQAYLRRVEDVLGKSWETHVDGKELKENGEAFRAKLDTNMLFDKWAADAQQRQVRKKFLLLSPPPLPIPFTATFDMICTHSSTSSPW